MNSKSTVLPFHLACLMKPTNKISGLDHTKLFQGKTLSSTPHRRHQCRLDNRAAAQPSKALMDPRDLSRGLACLPWLASSKRDEASAVLLVVDVCCRCKPPSHSRHAYLAARQRPHSPRGGGGSSPLFRGFDELPCPTASNHPPSHSFARPQRAPGRNKLQSSRQLSAPPPPTSIPVSTP